MSSSTMLILIGGFLLLALAVWLSSIVFMHKMNKQRGRNGQPLGMEATDLEGFNAVLRENQRIETSNRMATSQWPRPSAFGGLTRRPTPNATARKSRK